MPQSSHLKKDPGPSGMGNMNGEGCGRVNIDLGAVRFQRANFLPIYKDAEMNLSDSLNKCVLR